MYVWKEGRVILTAQYHINTKLELINLKFKIIKFKIELINLKQGIVIIDSEWDYFEID